MSEYTWEVLAVLAALIVLDRFSGVRLAARRRFWAVISCICIGTLVFDGYLNERPVLQYGWRYLSGVQLWVVPIEDFGYGVALASVAIIAWELMGRAGKRSG